MLAEFSTTIVFQKTFKYKALEAYFFKGFQKHTPAPCNEKTKKKKFCLF